MFNHFRVNILSLLLNHEKSILLLKTTIQFQVYIIKISDCYCDNNFTMHHGL